MMDEAYRLVFRGEVLDGQHPAVVKTRLVQALNLSDKQADLLFSGSAMVLKRQADTKTAARYQGLFKKAGARLRVMPIEERRAAPDEPRSQAVAAQTERMQMLPVGAEILRSDERAEVPEATVDVDHLDIQYGEPEPIARAVAATAVNVPEFSVADPGVDLLEHSEAPAQAPQIEADFDLAEVGADIPSIPIDRTPIVDIAKIRFDVAEIGADIGLPRDEPEARAPDISHLSLVAE
jgi:hypothetical protein